MRVQAMPSHREEFNLRGTVTGLSCLRTSKDYSDRKKLEMRSPLRRYWGRADLHLSVRATLTE